MKTVLPARAGGERDPAPSANPPRVFTTRELLGEQRQIRIEHQGECYVLRITSRGKLILTK
ncbi:MAG: hemin uptake protein HemP [Gammaproteobacteria bacterium]